MFDRIKETLGIKELEAKIQELEGQVGALEGQVDQLEEQVGALEGRVGELEGRFATWEEQCDSAFSELGDYKNRTREELEGMSTKIDHLIGQFNLMLPVIKDEPLKTRAKGLTRRLKNNRTRIISQLEKCYAQG